MGESVSTAEVLRIQEFEISVDIVDSRKMVWEATLAEIVIGGIVDAGIVVPEIVVVYVSVI